MEKDYLVQLQLQTAEKRIQQEKIDEALVLVEQILEDTPQNVEALFMAGQCYLLIGSALAAQEALHLCALQLPDNEELLCALSIAHFEACCFDSALLTAQNAIRINPYSGLAWRYIGLSQGHLGEFAESERAFEKAFLINPEQNPLPLPLPEPSVLDSALERLPPVPRRLYQDKTFHFAPLPTLEFLVKNHIPLDPMMPLHEQQTQNIITIYLHNLRYQFDRMESPSEKLYRILLEHSFAKD